MVRQTALLKASKKTDESRFLASSLWHFQDGRLDEADECCRLVLKANPDNMQANHLLGVIRFRQGRIAEASDLLKRAAASPMATAETFNNFGVALMKLGQTEEAIAAFEQALVLIPVTPMRSTILASSIAMPIRPIGPSARFARRRRSGPICRKQKPISAPPIATWSLPGISR